MKKYLTTKELQEWLDVNAVTVWRWRKAGMPFIKIGRNVRFEQEAVKSWFEEYNTIK